MITQHKHDTFVRFLRHVSFDAIISIRKMVCEKAL